MKLKKIRTGELDSKGNVVHRLAFCPTGAGGGVDPSCGKGSMPNYSDKKFGAKAEKLVNAALDNAKANDSLIAGNEKMIGDELYLQAQDILDNDSNVAAHFGAEHDKYDEEKATEKVMTYISAWQAKNLSSGSAPKPGDATSPKALKDMGFKYERDSGKSSSIYKHASGMKVAVQVNDRGQPIKIKSVQQPRAPKSEAQKSSDRRSRSLRNLERNRLYPSD